MESLTRAEAARRAALLQVGSYDVSLDLRDDGDVFNSITTVRFACADAGASMFVDLAPARLRRASLNGRELDPASLQRGRLPLPGLQADNELVVEAAMAYSHDGEGLHRHTDPADGFSYLYATSALAAAPRWFACFDQPDLKASLRLRVRCPDHWTLAASGTATRVGPGEWVCAPTPPIPTYLATLVAGRYRSITAEHDGIPLALHARASLAGQLERDAQELFSHTARCLDHFHGLFGIRYPWGEYHQAFVPEFNWGAMENPGCVTLRDQMLFRSRPTEAERAARGTTIAHEMAHMWFGDLVTMRWWDDLWLNESFAEYLGQRVCDAVTRYDVWAEFGINRKAWGHAADRRPSTHPVAGNGVTDVAAALNEFDGISYAKGASVLRQLAARLGEEVFLSGLRDYFAAHAYGNAELADLLTAWSRAGATDIGEWAEGWLRTPGLDTIAAVRDGSGVRLQRRTPREYPARRTHAVTVACYRADGQPLTRTPVLLDSSSTAVPGAADDAALVLPDAEDATWAKLGLDETSWSAAPELIPALPTSARVAVCNALRLALADAEVDPRRALRTVLALLRSETDEAVITAMAGWATETLAGRYLPAGGTRAAALDALADATAELLAGTEPGSGHQLVAARAHVAATADDVVLRRWLAGGAPDGLELDAELRWTLLQRLAALGAAGPQDIDAALEADHSAQGSVHATRARALLPDEAGKRAAWQRLMHDPQASNYELYALAQGFWHPQQESLTAPYVTRYFDEIAATAELRSGWVVGRVALYAYPWTAVAPSTLQHADQLLAAPSLHPGVCRSVLDATDDLRRALAGRQRWGGHSV